MSAIRALYKILSLLWDLTALAAGPSAFAKRQGRKAAYRKMGGWIR